MPSAYPIHPVDPCSDFFPVPSRAAEEEIQSSLIFTNPEESSNRNSQRECCGIFVWDPPATLCVALRAGYPSQKFRNGSSSESEEISQLHQCEAPQNLFFPGRAFHDFCWITPQRDAAKIMKHFLLLISVNQCRLVVKSS
jgi:hypothetical protein